MARKISIPSRVKNSGTSATCRHSRIVGRLGLRGFHGFFSDRINEVLPFARVFDGEVEDALVIDLQKLCEVFGNQQILASLDSCRG